MTYNPPIFLPKQCPGPHDSIPGRVFRHRDIKTKLKIAPQRQQIKKWFQIWTKRLASSAVFTIECRNNRCEDQKILRQDQLCNWSACPAPKLNIATILIGFPPIFCGDRSYRKHDTHISVSSGNKPQSWENDHASEHTLTMAVQWKLVAIFIALINSIEQRQCSGFPQGSKSCGPCWCVRDGAQFKADCISRNLTTIPAEIPDDVTAL